MENIMIAPLCWTVWKSVIEMRYCVLFGNKKGKQGHCVLERPDRVRWLFGHLLQVPWVKWPLPTSCTVQEKRNTGTLLCEFLANLERRA